MMLPKLSRILRTGLDYSGGFFDVDQKMKDIEPLDAEMAQSGFWDDNESAQKILQKRSGLQRSIEIWKNLEKEGADLGALLELSAEEEDPSMDEEIRSSLIQLQ